MIKKVNNRVTFEEHYFKANHGKDVADGIAGSVTQKVFRYILCGKVVIKSPMKLLRMQKMLFLMLVFRMWMRMTQNSVKYECKENEQYEKKMKVNCVRRSS